MRKLINIWFLLPALLLVWAVSATATTKQVTLSYNTSDFTYSTDGGVTCIVPADLMAVYGTDTLAPALPRYGVSVLIAPTQTYDTVTVTQSQTLVQSGVYIGPNTLPVPNDGTPPPSSPSLVNYAASEYPASGSEVVYTGCHDIDGYRVLTFSVSPFRYDAVNSNLYLRTALTLNISLSGQQQAPPIGGVPQPHHGGANMREAVSNLITNKTELEQVYPSSAVTNPLENPNFRYEYLIVTVDSLKDAFMPLVHWKTMKGIKAGILTVEEIRDNPRYSISSILSQNPMYINQRDSLAIQIKYALKDHYDGGYYTGLKYVLLGGEANIVPTVLCDMNIGIDDANKIVQGTTECDAFFGGLNQLGWDTNANDSIADLNDGIDISPNIVVTRYPCGNNQEVTGFVNKIIEYESSPNIDQIKDNILFAGGKEFGYQVDNVTYSEPHYKGNILYNSYVAPYWNGSRKYLYDTGNNLGLDEIKSTYFHGELNKGYSFVMEDSHGSKAKLLLAFKMSQSNNIAIIRGDDFSETIGSKYYLYSWDFDFNDLMSVNNNGYTVFITNACNTNEFATQASYPCFAFTALKHPNCGIIAYLGSSNSGFARYRINEFGSTNQFSAYFLKDILTSKKHRFGESVNNAKLAMMCFSNPSSCDSTNYYYSTEYRWVNLTENPLGDPEMPVYINKPSRLTNVSANLSNGTLTLSTGVDSCDVCIMSIADFGDTYYSVLKDISNAVINNVPDSCTLCVTKPGYIPFVVMMPHDGVYDNPLFIQNELLTGNNFYQTDRAYIGSNVTTSKPYGPVAVNNGSTIIIAKEGLKTTKDFQVKKGAEFKIEIRK